MLTLSAVLVCNHSHPQEKQHPTAYPGHGAIKDVPGLARDVVVNRKKFNAISVWQNLAMYVQLKVSSDAFQFGTACIQPCIQRELGQTPVCVACLGGWHCQVGP